MSAFFRRGPGPVTCSNRDAAAPPIHHIPSPLESTEADLAFFFFFFFFFFAIGRNHPRTFARQLKEASSRQRPAEPSFSSMFSTLSPGRTFCRASAQNMCQYLDKVFFCQFRRGNVVEKSPPIKFRGPQAQPAGPRQSSNWRQPCLSRIDLRPRLFFFFSFSLHPTIIPQFFHSARRLSFQPLGLARNARSVPVQLICLPALEQRIVLARGGGRPRPSLSRPIQGQGASNMPPTNIFTGAARAPAAKVWHLDGGRTKSRPGWAEPVGSPLAVEHWNVETPNMVLISKAAVGRSCGRSAPLLNPQGVCSNKIFNQKLGPRRSCTDRPFCEKRSGDGRPVISHA